MNGPVPIDAPAEPLAGPAPGSVANSVANPGAKSLLVEIERAVKTGTPQRRVYMLQQVTDLFLSAAGRMNENQVAAFDDIFIRLVEWMEPVMLAQLSAALADADVAPRRVVAHLAYHHEAFVAMPVLAKSNRLSEGDLIMIANARSPQHLLAISGRDRLSSAVTDIVLQRGNSIVFHALANNTGAQFSGSGFAILIGATRGDEVLAHKLGLRADIPASTLRTLLSAAPCVVRARLLKVASPEIRERIEQAI